MTDPMHEAIMKALEDKAMSPLADILASLKEGREMVFKDTVDYCLEEDPSQEHLFEVISSIAAAVTGLSLLFSQLLGDKDAGAEIDGYIADGERVLKEMGKDA